VKGNRLDERLKQYGAMKFEKAKNLMLQLLSGLMEAHRRQIVHRDLKPANIILSKKEGYADQVVILDFGLSKALGASEDQALQNVTVVDSRRVYGTPQYISPEQLTTGKLGPWTDVYAAGLIFYELLTGTPAVDGESLFDIAYKQSYEPIVFPENLCDTVIEAIINKACAKNPADRYKHAGEFFDALQHVEDISDPLSVLRDSSRGGQNLASIGMLEKTRDETAEMKTQIGLSAIVADEDLGVPVQHAEHTKQHRSMASSLLLVATTFISIVFILVIVAWFLGYIEVVLKF
jgi:serine/threonine protein kinase